MKKGVTAYPNHTKTVLLANVLKHDAGEPRSFRRAEAARARLAASRHINLAEQAVAEGLKLGRQAKVEKRVKRATMRREDRELAKKTGEPVKYRIQ